MGKASCRCCCTPRPFLWPFGGTGSPWACMSSVRCCGSYQIDGSRTSSKASTPHFCEALTSMTPLGLSRTRADTARVCPPPVHHTNDRSDSATPMARFALRPPSSVTATTLSVSGCIAGEDEVALADGLVAGKARLHGGRRTWFAVLIEGRVPPAASRGVLLRVLDHELEVELRGGAGHERLGTAEGLVVLLRRDVAPGDAADDRAFGERELSSPIGVDRHVVPQHGANIFEVTFFVGHRDHLPVAVSRRNRGDEERGGLLSRGLASRARQEGHNAHEGRHCTQQGRDSFHETSSCQNAIELMASIFGLDAMICPACKSENNYD